MWCLPLVAALLFLAGSASTTDQNSSMVQENWCGEQQNTCGLHDDDGPWMSALQQWALSAPEHGERQGRIMALPPAQGYYVTDRADGPLLSPPAPPSHAPQHGKPNHPNHPLPPGARPYDEWQHSPLQHSAGKIVNRPPNPYKDKFKPSPSYPAPVQKQPIPVHSHAVERVDETRQPPHKQVSQTDLYLLGAIEKLVWRADLFEKRLRKLEENVHLMLAGDDFDEEPCAENFTRVGSTCYYVSADVANWKGANFGCRRLQSNMLEIDSDREKEQLTARIFSDNKLKGDLNTNRGFILINPGEVPYSRGSGHTYGNVPKMCSLVKCVWLFKHIRALVYLLSGSIVYALLHFIARRIIPNIVLTGRFAEASLKVANTVQLSPLFPMHKMNKNQ